jgi:DNA-binding protein H-NS
MTTLKALQDKIAILQTQAEAIARKESSAALEKIRALMQKHGLTTDDIAVGFRKPTTGRKSTVSKTPATPAAAAKYLNPRTGATWSGRGRAPAWIANAEDRSEFLVERAGSSAGVAKRTPKSGNRVRGAQTLVYRDPQSGSIWSGRGQAPAWLATAKNPIEYLIETFPGGAEPVPAMEGARRFAAKQAGSATKGIADDGHGDSERQARREDVQCQKADRFEKESTPVIENTAAKLVNVQQAPVESVAAVKASVVEALTHAVQQDIASELTSA